MGSGDCNGGTPSPAPTTGCDGPFSDKDNGGTNMNTGGETTSADACKQECEATDGCKGYTWKTDSTQCWLKSSVDEYVYDALSASGDCNGGIVIDNEGGTDNVDIGSVPAGATVWSQLRARIKLSKDNPSVPCSEINTTENFCCWWPLAFTCGTCEK